MDKIDRQSLVRLLELADQYPDMTFKIDSGVLHNDPWWQSQSGIWADMAKVSIDLVGLIGDDDETA